MDSYDYIIIGAGSAGCVLAERLTALTDARVLIIEAGGRGRHPAFQIPKAMKFALGNDRLTWNYQTRPIGSGHSEIWARGKALGGSSTINGMVWNRGFADDFDAIEALGNPGWGWDTILPIYRLIETHQLGASETRGGGGPLHISVSEEPEPVCEAVISSAEQAGLARVDDVNASDAERIGYTPATIRDGVRFSAARAFLTPTASRRRLEILTRTRALNVIIERGRAVGVRVRDNNGVTEHRAGSEVILALGSLATPQLLELSGIGQERVLRAAGAPMLVESPNVGERLREHRAVKVQWRLRDGLGYNPMINTPLRQAMSGARYLLTRRGPLALPAYDLMAFAKTDTSLGRPDAMVLLAPFSLRSDLPIEQLQPESEPGVNYVGCVLRPESEGSIHITSADPFAAPDIDPGYLTSERDRRGTAEVLRLMRRLARDGPVSEMIVRETYPGPRVESDAAIIATALNEGQCGYHATGTCAMGPDEASVVDSELRVRGVEALRVVDGSVLPVIPSGNINGPIMALAWHAAELIAAGRHRTDSQFNPGEDAKLHAAS